MAKTITPGEYIIPDEKLYKEILKIYFDRKRNIKTKEITEVKKSIPKIGDEPYYTDLIKANMCKETHTMSKIISMKNRFGIYRPIIKITGKSNGTYTMTPANKKITKPVEDIFNKIEEGAYKRT